jgi:hypothetical protein
MKTTMLYSFILLTLLGLGISCKKEVEPVKPPVVVSPPTSTTTPPVSPTITTPAPETIISATYVAPNSIETAYADVPQPPANCRIARTTYKTVVLQGPILEPETIMVDGRIVTVATQTKTSYQYDNQGRLVLDRRVQTRGKTDSLRYKYSPDSVVVNRDIFSFGDNRYYNWVDLLPIDNKGLVKTDVGVLQYDSEGFLLKRASSDGYNVFTYEIVKNNITKTDYYSGYGWGTETFAHEYYPTRPNLPTLTPFYGRESQNLPAKMTRSVKGSSFYSDGLKHQIVYIYVFDGQGRVKRRIASGTKLSPGWPFEADTYGIGVTDYEYENCP